MTAAISTVTATATNPGNSRARLAALVALVVVVLVVLGSLSAEDSRPYRLDDPGEFGYAGLSRSLERLGATFTTIDADEVSAGLHARADTLFVPQASGASTTQLARWRAFARGGGHVVLGGQRPASGDTESDDPSAGLGSGFDVIGQDPGRCNIEQLSDLSRIDPGGSARVRVGREALSCFGDGSTAFVTLENGVFTIGGPELFTNEAMRPKNQEIDDPKGPMEDNVVLAQRLLAPEGRDRIAVVTSGVQDAPAAAGNQSIFSQMSTGVRLGLWQLVVAAALFCLVVSRRLGRVVNEPQPVPIAGSELVEAVGNLMERRRDPSHAAALIRADVLDRVARRLGLGSGAPATIVAPVVAARTQRDPAAVLALLAPSSVSSDAQLVELSRQLEQLRQEILGE